MVHNLEYELSLGCTVDGVTDCRVSAFHARLFIRN